MISLTSKRLFLAFLLELDSAVFAEKFAVVLFQVV
jgi:hypothetical protein